MHLQSVRTVIAFVLLSLFTLSVSALPYAHGKGTGVFDADLQTYVAAGGLWSDLCETDDTLHNHADCPFCREIDATDDGVSATPTQTAVSFSVPAWRLAEKTHDPLLPHVVHPARAPPFE